MTIHHPLRRALTMLCASAVIAGFFAPVSLSAQEKKSSAGYDLTKLSSQDFLAFVRHAPSRELWTKLSGKAQHRRDQAATLTTDVRLGIRFTPDRIIGQLVLDGCEVYNIGQTFSDPPRTTRVFGGRALEKEKAKLGILGLSPDDLLMGFLYKEMVCECAPVKVSLYSCRVFVMNADAGEFARVAISTDYAFPLKVEWFKKDPSKNPSETAYRTLEIVAVKEIKKNFVLVSKVHLDGPGWRTKIEFDSLDAGYASDSIPADLFMKR